MLNNKEIEFVNSIKNKIEKYSIPVDLKEALEHSSKEFFETVYNSGEKELVDLGIEKFICSKSAFYFIKRYCFISVPNIGIIPFNLYYFQEEIMKEIGQYKKYIFCKSRQAGISTVMSFYCLWRSLFRDSESISIVSKKKDAAQDFITKMKITLDYLPYFLRQKITSDNKSSIVFGNNSEIRSEARSPNAGRSNTLSLLVLDEAAFYGTDKMVRSIIASSSPTLTRTGGAIIIISSPNGSSGEGSYFFEQVNHLKNFGNTKTEKLVEIDWWEVPDMPNIFPHKGYNNKLNELVAKKYFNDYEARSEGKKYFEPIQNNWKNNPWLKTQFDTLKEALFRQEILHDFITMGNSVFNKDLLDRVRSKVKDPIIKDMVGNTMYQGVWIWKQPERGHRYIICCDVATGTGNDYSSFQILDVEKYEQVCEFSGFLSTPNFSRLIRKIANYYNQAYAVIESNSIGEAVFNNLYYDENEPYRNMFKQERSKNNITRMTGWITDIKTRKLICNELIDWISVDELFETTSIYSERFLSQLSTWIWKDGRCDHPDGGNDDAVIAMAMAFYLRNKATATGVSFIIDEKGNSISMNSREDIAGDNDGFYGIQADCLQDAEDKFEEKNGMTKEQYRWLQG